MLHSCSRSSQLVPCLVLRLGKPLEHLQAALKATQLQAPTAEQFTSVARQLGYAGYLTYDALLWVGPLWRSPPTSF
jgi:hypothetical protein